MRTPSRSSASRSSAASATGQRPNTGWVRPPLAAQARPAPSATAASSSRAPRSRGKNGVSVAMLSDPGVAGPVRRGPVQAGQDAGERTGEIGDGVGDHGQAEGREPPGVAVGVEHERVHLRPGALDHLREQRPPAERPQAFVAAAHAPRLAAGEQEAADAGSVVALRSALAGVAAVLLGRHAADRRRRRCARRRTGRGSAGRGRGRSGSGSALRASSTPQAVKPERETRIGMPICTVLITISEVSRPVV